MQAGSDDVQACASCHFNAGADSRPANTLNPGQAGGDNNFELGPQVAGVTGPNHFLNPGSSGAGFGGYHDGDFPFRKLANPDDRVKNVVSDLNDVAGSQGVFATTMGGVTVTVDVPAPSAGTGGNNDVSDPGVGDGEEQPEPEPGFQRGPGGVRGQIHQPSVVRRGTQQISSLPRAVGKLPVTNSVETNTAVPDPVFSYPDPENSTQRINTRKVTGRNTPSAVNAVFNFRNFWDGRAQNVCNGNNPFGARDGQFHLVIADAG